MTLADHLPILPVLLPSLTAILMLLIGDDPERRPLVRGLALLSVALGAVLGSMLVMNAAEGTLMVYRLGDWPAPFGIVLVIDRLSALMLLLTSAVALPVLLYASGGWDAH
ncbi:MAG: monovalent cation/H+ antiporter subunit D, partial [Rubrivivax sp.]